MGKVYTRFQAKRLKTRAFWAAHTYMANLREYPPPPLPGCYSYERLEGSSKFLLSLFSGEETFKDDEFMTQFYTKWARWSTVLLSVNAWKKIQPVPEKKN